MSVLGSDNENRLKRLIPDDMLWFAVYIAGPACTPLNEILERWPYSDIAVVYSILKSNSA